jgi:hypothetical protein
MKINQLFRKTVDMIMVLAVLRCFNLHSLLDCTPFSKRDLVRIRTAERLGALFHQLQDYYIPCKGRMYLVQGSLGKALTVLKQVVRLYDYRLASREQTHGKQKLIMYHLTHSIQKSCPCHQTHGLVQLCFD